MMDECEEYIACVVLAPIGPHLRLIGDTAIDSNRFIPEIRGSGGVNNADYGCEMTSNC